MMKKLLTFFLFGLIALTSAFAQAQKVSGKVVGSDDGLPLPGVTIKVAGTQRGVLTNGDGMFTVDATVGSQLVFSYIGFTGQTITVPPGNFPLVKLAVSTRLL